MDNSGSNTNTTGAAGGQAVASPFAPVDIPDLNSIAAPSAVPPLNAAVKMPEGNAGATDAALGKTKAAETKGGSATDQPITQEASGVTMADIPQPAMKAENPNTGTGEPKAEAGGANAGLTEATNGVAEVTNGGANGAIGANAMAKGAVVLPSVNDVEIAASSLPSVRDEMEMANGLTIEPLLEECIKHEASDLHLQVGLPPVLRIDGTLQPMTTYPVLDNDLVRKLVFATLDEDQQKILMKDKEFDYSFAFGDLGRFRVNAFHEKGNMAAAFRLIPNKILTIEDLGIPGVVASFADHPSGLVLVTGPTGSGKSTTLAALIDKINTERAVHIITIEDPIEFTHRSKRALVAQREVHYDTYSFAAALRSILREDPDVVLIGEMRDLETIQAAITTAETGHLVFATLHTNSAAQSIDRMIDVFPAHQQPQIRSQLANILVGICAQRLVPAINGGRIAVAEILVSNPAVRSIIREGKTHQLDMTIQTGVEQGMQTMDRELAKLVKAGTINYDVAREYAIDSTEFDRLAKG